MSERERGEGGSVGVVGGGKYSLDSFRNTGTGFSQAEYCSGTHSNGEDSQKNNQINKS